MTQIYRLKLCARDKVSNINICFNSTLISASKDNECNKLGQLHIQYNKIPIITVIIDSFYDLTIIVFTFLLIKNIQVQRAISCYLNH